MRRPRGPKPARLGERLSGGQPGFVPLVAVVEFVWVLSSRCGLKPDGLLRRQETVVDRADLVLQAQRRFAKGGADRADCLIERIAQTHGCATTMTFDTGAAKPAGMTLVA